jgi:very-short-patch-repair endonuclease
MSMPSMSSRMKRHARAMRRNPTRSEGRMWSWLRNRRFLGYKFRRQVPIGRYIVDFYCAELKMVIELDGTHHRSAGMDEYDDRRTYHLRQGGLHMLRIPNEQLIRDSEIVVEMIKAAIGQCLRSRENLPPHPPVGTFSPS